MLIGTLLLLNQKGGNPFSADDQALIEKLAAVAAPFLSNAQKIQQFFLAALPELSLLKKYEAFGLLGKSKSFVQLLQSIESAARCSIRILLEGESGTGKELVAISIHRLGPRGQNRFLAVDCGAIPANLIESELFGHVRGAFTGAAADRKGLLEEADGGTLFMDEITNLPLDMQSKLLRVLQEGEIRPLGGNRTRKVDVRIITASSVSLRSLVDKQQFRRIFLQAERLSDLGAFFGGTARGYSPTGRSFRQEIFTRSEQIRRSHPRGSSRFSQTADLAGNIRELENFIERLVTLAPSDLKVLDTAILPQEYQKERERLKRIVEPDPRTDL